jgi:hypothetical protein
MFLEKDMGFEDLRLSNKEMSSFQFSIFGLNPKKIYEVSDELRAKAFFNCF